MHGESRAYAWTATESGRHNNNSRLWRHGRAHVRIAKAGRRRYYEAFPGSVASRQPDWGQRSDLGVDVSWYLLPDKHSRFGLGFELKWGTNGSETTPDISLYAGPLGSIWIHAIHWFPYRWFNRYTPSTRHERTPEAIAAQPHGMFSFQRSGKEGLWETNYDTRVFSLNLRLREFDGRQFNPEFRWEIWARDNHWSRSDPKWMQGHIDLRRLLLGNKLSTNDVIASGTCTIPMPEMNYPAIWETRRYTQPYTRPLGKARDRIFGPNTWTLTDVTPSVPIPIPGKGESDYDCGDDAIHGMSCGGTSYLTVVGNIVSSALKTREQHGGMEMSIPKMPPPPNALP